MSTSPITPFTAHRLYIEVEARDEIILGQHTGSALRGMFYRALMALTGAVPTDDPLEFLPNEPVRYLLSSMDEEGERGRDIPRPYTIEPIIHAANAGERVVYSAGQRFRFGLTLYARAIELFPYVILALKRGEEMGIGASNRDGRRGRFNITRVWCGNPLTGQEMMVYTEGDNLVRVPDLPITHEDVLAASTPVGHTLALEFLTPLTLREQKQSVGTPRFSILVHRLIERLTELSEYFAGARLPCLPLSREDRAAMLHLADGVILAYDWTSWVTVQGHSARQHAPTALSGIMGVAIYEADVACFEPFMPLLRWGEIVHAGKHAVKGNGLFRVVPR